MDDGPHYLCDKIVECMVLLEIYYSYNVSRLTSLLS